MNANLRFVELISVTVTVIPVQGHKTGIKVYKKICLQDGTAALSRNMRFPNDMASRTLYKLEEGE
jgi:hypothetical protein